MIDKFWYLGEYSRGHGHYSYAVILSTGAPVVETKTDRNLAEHITEIHNTWLQEEMKKAANSPQSSQANQELYTLCDHSLADDPGVAPDLCTPCARDQYSDERHEESSEEEIGFGSDIAGPYVDGPRR